MNVCLICSQEFKNSSSLSRHISTHNFTKKLYYDKFVRKENEGFCICGNKTTFRGNKYLKYCSKKCHTNDPKTRILLSEKATGKIQSQETIEKRIKNTNQLKKEKTRTTTMVDRYGSLSHFSDPELRNKKISTSHIGKKHTKLHHQNVIESKRKNKTLNHTQETKDKIRHTINILYQSDNPPITISSGSPKGYKTGRFNDIAYRSSYELTFLQYCDKHNIRCESASTKEFRVKYFNQDKNKYCFYYPDFYLSDYDTIIEIKPVSMINEIVIEKLNSLDYAFSLITEEELSNLDKFFDNL